MSSNSHPVQIHTKASSDHPRPRQGAENTAVVPPAQQLDSSEKNVTSASGI